ncbi:MAG: hypothetical protein U0W40_00725 [Acidimicrobiia bacterium]
MRSKVLATFLGLVALGAVTAAFFVSVSAVASVSERPDDERFCAVALAVPDAVPGPTATTPPAAATRAAAMVRSSAEAAPEPVSTAASRIAGLYDEIAAVNDATLQLTRWQQPSAAEAQSFAIYRHYTANACNA